MMPTAACIFNVFFWCIAAKMSKFGLRRKGFVEIKPVSVVEHVEIWTLFAKV